MHVRLRDLQVHGGTTYHGQAVELFKTQPSLRGDGISRRFNGIFKSIGGHVCHA